MGNLRKITLLLVSVTVLASGCGMDRPTRPRTRVQESEEFKAARVVIEERCINCHKNQHNRWEGWTEQDYIADDLVVPGDPDNSYLIQKLKQNGGNMPESSTITATQYNLLREWILSIQ